MKKPFSVLAFALVLALLAPSAGAQRVVASRFGSHGGVASTYAHYPTYSSSRTWVPGHYESVCRSVWIPGSTERVWVEARYALAHGACGERLRVLVSPAHWELVQRPGHSESRNVRIWVPGRWVARAGTR